MKFLVLTIKLILILNVSLLAYDSSSYYLNGLYPEKKSKFKVIKTNYINPKNNIKQNTLRKYNNQGNLEYFKREIQYSDKINIYEGKFFYESKNKILYVYLENNTKILDQYFIINDDGNFLEIKAVYPNNNKKYLTIYKYSNKFLKSIVVKNLNNEKVIEIQELSYDNKNRIKKVSRKGIADDGTSYEDIILFEYNEKNKIIEETLVSNNILIENIKYLYNIKQLLSSKIIERKIDEKEKLTLKIDYKYNNEGELLKEIEYNQNGYNSETIYFYE